MRFGREATFSGVAKGVFCALVALMLAACMAPLAGRTGVVKQAFASGNAQTFTITGTVKWSGFTGAKAIGVEVSYNGMKNGKVVSIGGFAGPAKIVKGMSGSYKYNFQTDPSWQSYQVVAAVYGFDSTSSNAQEKFRSYQIYKGVYTTLAAAETMGSRKGTPVTGKPGQVVKGIDFKFAKPHKVSALKVEAGNNKLTVSWKNYSTSSNNVSYYRVCYRQSGHAWACKKYNANSTHKVTLKLKNKKTYFVKVQVWRSNLCATSSTVTKKTR
ncbi:MAG: fibronectin type III domain-containing protein [Coriobacteriales bacterium]|jgi:hypothetical protein|nr:fibronectin type III domain-containing protein [Coriobacteriales bacterium]